jgi:hypothetical protein
MNRKAILWSISVALTAVSIPWAHAEDADALAQPASTGRITLTIAGEAPADVAHSLGEALGAEVRFDGSLPRTLTVALKDLPATEALDKVASAVGGKWEPVYRFTKNEAPPGPVTPTGLTLSLRLTDVPCATAAAMVARMVNAKLETEGEIEGMITLSGGDMPVEEALDAIATAAGMVWRPIYLVHASNTPVVSGIKPAGGNDATALGADPTKRMRRDSGKRKRVRDKYHMLGALGAAPEAPPKPVDLQKLEELSNLGLYAGIFGIEDETERKMQVKRFIAGMESMARKLENYQPHQRRAAEMALSTQLQQYIVDVDALSHDQRQEVQPLIDYIKKRLQEMAPPAQPQP